MLVQSAFDSEALGDLIINVAMKTSSRGRSYAMTNVPETAGRQAAVDCLNRLGEELTSHGFTCRVMTPRGAAVYARVTNDAVPQLRDDISCFPASGRDLWFWWSWGERIAPAGEIPDVVRKVRYVLAPPD